MMDQRIQQLRHQVLPLPAAKTSVANAEQAGNFKDLLGQAQGLKVSKHAEMRLQQRNIDIEPALWQKISNKVTEAKQKGITDSLVVMSNAALLVSTKNHTVVTAMDRKEAASRIFTNINGTILMDD